MRQGCVLVNTAGKWKCCWYIIGISLFLKRYTYCTHLMAAKSVFCLMGHFYCESWFWSLSFLLIFTFIPLSAACNNPSALVDTSPLYIRFIRPTFCGKAKELALRSSSTFLLTLFPFLNVWALSPRLFCFSVSLLFVGFIIFFWVDCWFFDLPQCN